MFYFSAKPLMQIQGDVTLARPSPVEQPAIAMESPATALMSDFVQTQPVTVSETTQIDEALQQMAVAGVRLLFVTDAEYRLIGLITSYDIAGEKPLLYLQSRNAQFNSAARSTILVRHIMQPIAIWRVLDYSVVQRALVGDIVETFKKLGRRYFVVMDTPAPGEHRVRGLLSARRFERALGIAFEPWQRPSSFAEIERTIGHPSESTMF